MGCASIAMTNLVVLLRWPGVLRVWDLGVG